MKDDLGKEVAVMLNIEAGEALYLFNEEVRLVLRRGYPSTRVYVDGFEAQLVVFGQGHRRNFRFGWRMDGKPDERFDWAAIHKRVEKLLAEEIS